MSKVLHVINPAGLGGGGLAAWDAFKALRPDAVAAGRVVVTERTGHAREIAAAAVDCDVIVAVGGDGTVGEVMSGIMDRQGPRPALAIVPAGTGNDIARQVGIRSVADAAAALQAGNTRAVDLVRVDWRDGERPAHRHAYLFGLAGFSAAPRLKPWMKRVLGAAAAYYLATFLQFLVYRAPHMTIQANGREFRGRYWMVIVGNAEWSGGGSMRLAPGARTDDGLLDISLIVARPKLEMLVRLLPRIPTGAHVHQTSVEYFQGQTVEVECTPPAVVDLDGDIVGSTPATFTVCPGALRILAPLSPRPAS